MGDLILKGQPTLNLAGTLKLVGSNGGKITVNGVEALVETTKGQGTNQGLAAAPVPIPPPPGAPSDPGMQVWVFKSFNQRVTANGKMIVTQGLCAQGLPSRATWPGMMQPSSMNFYVTINHIFINVVGDTCTVLPTGAPAAITSSGQSNEIDR